MVAVTGCVTIESPDLTIQPVAQYSLHQVKGDLFVAVEPFRDKEKVSKHFGTDLLSDGILPVLVVIENHNRTSSFVSLKEKFSFTILDQSISRRETESLLAPFPETAATILGTGLVTNPIALHFSTNASKIKHNLTTKELRTKTIPPGSSQHGFVYFKLRDKDDITTNSVVSVKALNLQTDEVITFIFASRGI